MGIVSSAIAAVQVARAAESGHDGRGRGPAPGQRVPLADIAVETAPHPEQPVVAFTSIGLGDGYQLYVAEGVDSVQERVSVREDVRAISDAEAGVHAVHWTSTETLKYSQDGRTLERDIAFAGRSGRLRTTAVRVVAERPLPVSGPATDRRIDAGGRATTQSLPNVDIPYPIDCKSGGNVCCTDLPFVSDWCLRLIGSDSGHVPECDNHNPPPMPHGHFAIFPSGNDNAGINIWVGKDGNCIWVGEENRTKWCTQVCGPEGGMPSLSDLKDAFEDAINQAADAAGIAIPAIVVTALAYYLAASTLAPPVGVPGI